MSAAWVTLAGWLLRTAVGGGLLLLLAWALMRRTRQPARRQRLGECGVVAGLAVALLSIAPAQWLSLPDLHPTIRLRLAESPGPQRPVPQAEKPSGDSNPPASDVPSDPTPAASTGPDAAVLPADPPAAFAEFPVPQRDPAHETAPAPAVGADPPLPAEKAVAAEAPPASSAPAESGWLSLLPVAVHGLVFAYVLGAAFLAGRWLCGYLALRGLLRTAGPAPKAVAQLFADMAAARGAGARLLVSRRLRVPLSCGLFRPTVVIPSALGAPAPSPALRCVFAHELTHLERRDIWACLLFGLGQLVYYYLPWFWWLRRQVGLCQEYVADAAAARESAGAEEYAQFLLTLTGVPAVPAGAQGVAGNSSDLFRRVSMLLQSPVQVEKRCPRLWSLAVAGGLLALAVVVAAVGLHANAAPPDDPRDPAAAEPAKLDKDPAKKEEPKLERTKEPAKEEPKPDADKDPARKEEPARKPAARPKRLDPEALRKRLEQMMREGASPEEMQKEMMKAMEVFRAQVPGGPLGGGFPQHMIEFGKAMQRRHEFTAPVDGRAAMGLGAILMKPSAALRDQLDLPPDQGLVLEYLLPDSPAATAGLKVNDILLELDGKPVPSESHEFARLVEGIKADTSVDVVILRKGKKETIKGLALQEAPGAAGFGGPPLALPVFPIGMPPLPLGPQVPAPPGVLPPLPLGGGHAVMTTVVRTGDRITTRYQEGNLIITLTGSVAEGKARIGEIHVQDGAVTHRYDSADKVPELYRDKVKGLIEMSEKGNIRVETKAP
jgi:hypothetical protein